MDQDLIEKYLNDECTPSEAERVIDWFATPEGQQYLEQQIDRDARVLGEFGEFFEMPEPSSDELFDDIQADKETGFGFREVGNRSSGSQWKMVASILLLVGVLAFASWYYLNKWTPQQRVVATNSRQQKTLVLPDSSKIVLHHDSRVEYSVPFRNQREVNLEGEAYFEVEHDEDHPFIVYVDSSYVKVLGTKFVVSEYSNPEGIEVAVKSGRVELGTQQSKGKEDAKTITKTHSEDAIEIPMDKVGITKKDSGPKITKDVDSAELLDWVEGKLIFHNTPLTKVLDELEGRYGVRFNVRDQKLLQKNFTSSFDDESLSEVLTVLKISLDVNTKRVGDTIYLSKQ